MNNIIKNKNFIKKYKFNYSKVFSDLTSLINSTIFLYKYISFILLFAVFFSVEAIANKLPEVFQETHTEVLVREHPQTGESYVTIISDKEPVPEDPLGGRNKYSRPDYRMLDPQYKSKDIPYDGPYSSKKKIYILAASLATVGAGGAVIGATVFPAAASTAATGSAIGPAVGAVATGVGSVALAKKFEGKDLPEDYARIQESRLLETENDFYQLHIKPRKN